ncbi:MAG: hypothetical protein RMN52_00800 [Anaerolineae bacterium]|nr:hypothetical protein [Candidatus Roseilinea sp.]MDW8448515.1 hypothetical protein [Anaerolineae bacterium]
MQTRIGALILFILLALIAFSELIFSNLGTLSGDLAGAAQMLGLTPAQERTRLFILITLDAIAGVGALLAIIGLLARNKLIAYGASLCAIGFLAYAIYQIFAALTQLSATVRLPVIVAGALYTLLSVAAWFTGRRAAALARIAQ